MEIAYGSSGNFFAQIGNRAPFDVFLSADVEYPRRLVSAGIGPANSVFTYAVGRLVVWVPAGSPLDPATALRDPRVKHVAIANPQHAPYGRAAQAALRSLGLYQSVEPKLVLGENIAQTLQFVESGAADAGIVALSLALAPPVRARGRYWEIPAGRISADGAGRHYPEGFQGGTRFPRVPALRRRAADLETIRFLRAGRVIWTGRQSGSAYGWRLRPRRFCWRSVCPIAYWLTFSPRRWKFLVEALVALPLVLPPTVLGFYVLLAIGPRSPLGAIYAKLTGGMLPFSFQGLLLASVLYSFPFTVQPVAAAFAGVDRKLLEASWCLGVSRAATFRRVIVPLALPGIATGAILSFAHTLGEFGVVLMVGGNIAGVTRTVSISIYDSVQALDYGAASATSLFLLCVSFTVLALTYALQRRIWAVWPIN